MKDKITINGKDYFISSSAWTAIKYKNDYGRSLLTDLNSISDIRAELENGKVEDIDNLTNIILRITYTLITEADSKQVGSYEDFLKSISSIYDNTDWILKVIEVATFPILGKNLGNKA